MNYLMIPIRYLHVLSAAIWLGEVVVINFIMIPILTKYDKEGKSEILVNIFPKLFKMASILSAITVITGAILLWFYTKYNFDILLSSRWGLSILIGGLLGLLLTLFHFFLENKLLKLLLPKEANDIEKNHTLVYSRLKIIPRIGLVVITSIFFLMMFAERGI
ncbi:MAG: DUF4149 domain-containing protein [Vicingaceae bacterium]|nr:MAG: DUF4149 domain-containing protein [Vicingaceae bacterium]